MRLREVWRLSTFQLSLVFAILFVVGVSGLLYAVDVQAVRFLDRRIDGIVRDEAAALLSAPPGGLQRRVALALQLGDGVNVFGVFDADRRPLEGNLRSWPAGLRPGGRPMELRLPRGPPAFARAAAFPLPDGRLLVVGRDAQIARELRGIIASALAWSGAGIVVLGALLGVGLSLRPLSRLRRMQAIAGEIAAGDFGRRMPQSGRGDELDRVAAAVNAMVGEVARLMQEVKAATDSVAHDLRTPLTHVRAGLSRLGETAPEAAAEARRLLLEVDEVLERFRALLRLSELELGARQSGFRPVDLVDVARRAVELHGPVAEERGAEMRLEAAGPCRVHADPKLMFELISNLLDNALKFAGDGAQVRVRLRPQPRGCRLDVEDDGPGVPEAERGAVLQRFHRASNAALAPGSGLGLSVVAAIVRLHRFHLSLEDARPGLRVSVSCPEAPDPAKLGPAGRNPAEARHG